MSVATQVIADLLGRGHAVLFRASGDSMHPIIRSNDYLLVEPAAQAKIRRGDVVLTLADRGLTAHRVIAFDGQMVVTRGDNARRCDLPVPASRLLGRVTHAERGGRRRRVTRWRSALLLRVRRLAARLRNAGVLAG